MLERRAFSTLGEAFWASWQPDLAVGLSGELLMIEGIDERRQ